MRLATREPRHLPLCSHIGLPKSRPLWRPAPSADARGSTTSDSAAVLPAVKAALPPGARVVHNLRHGFMHTGAGRHDKAKMIEPYLDNYLLGKANALGSCWTTYAIAGHFQHPASQRVVVQ